MDTMTSFFGFPDAVASWLALQPFGQWSGDRFIITNNCLALLHELNWKIINEDTKHLHQLRCAFGSTDIFQENLIPLLIASEETHPVIFCSTLKVLMNLTTPIQCLIRPEIADSPSPQSQQIVSELKQLLYKAKDALSNRKPIKAILGFVKRLSEKQKNDGEMSRDEVESVNHSLVLIRNLLEAPERPAAGPNDLMEIDNDEGDSSDVSHVAVHRYYQHFYSTDADETNLVLITNLFATGIDRIIIHLLEHANRDWWVVSIVQMMGLLYQNQPVEDMKRMLDSKKDIRCQEKKDHNRRHPVLKKTLKKRTIGMKHLKSTDLFGTRPNAGQQAKSKDLSLLLNNFTGSFLMQGFNTLASRLFQLLSARNGTVPFDPTHFMWLVKYFLGLADVQHPKVEIDILADVLSTATLRYLTAETVRLAKLLLLTGVGTDYQIRLRLQLGVNAIGQYLNTMEFYAKRYQTQHQTEKLAKIEQLRLELVDMDDLRQLFPLLLARYSFKSQKDFLHDVIETNHALLLSLNRAIGNHQQQPTNNLMKSHLAQFCSQRIVHQYSVALSSYRTNNSQLNDSVFTMLHHIGIELDGSELLCQHPGLIETFGKIWTRNFDIIDEWHDLIELIMQKFMKKLKSDRAIHKTAAPESNFGFNCNEGQDVLANDVEIFHFQFFRKDKIRIELTGSETSYPLHQHQAPIADDNWANVRPEDLPDHFFLSKRKC